MSDLLELYQSGLIETELRAEEVASPIFSMSIDSPLKDVLNEMLSRRVRRVFVSPENEVVVTDRDVINYIFSTSRLASVSKSPESLLDAELGDLSSVKPLRVSNNTIVREAALLTNGLADSCLVCDKGVLTPWDLVMKPLINGELMIRR